MDYTDEELADLAEMRALRLRLRACVIAKVAECEAFEAAKTTLELNRQIKAIDGADRLVTVLYTPRRSTTPSPPLPAQHSGGGAEHAQPQAKRVEAEGATRPNKPNSPLPTDSLLPPHVLDGTVVPEASTSLPPADNPPHALAPAFADDDEDLDLPTIPPANQKIIDAVNQATFRFAEHVGIWPNGTTFIPGGDGWRGHALTEGLAAARDIHDHDARTRREILLRANMIAGQSGRRTGLCLDGTPFSLDRLDYFTLSANAGTGVQRPAAHEMPGSEALPWWIVRAPP